MFYKLSEYKPVDSLGRHLNNTGIPSTRSSSNWYDLSIDLKKGYKFSIAMENATYRGYTSEKIISSLEAHTIPIYWGDPAITDLINPKAFINCQDYASIDEVVERVKEIDNNDDLWLDMVTQPWQTEEQIARTLQMVADYDSSIRNIFAQDINQAFRRPIGAWGNTLRRDFAGCIPPLNIRVARKIKHWVGLCIPKPIKLKIKELLHMDNE